MAAPAWPGALAPEIFAVVPLDSDRCVVKLDLYGIRLETIFVLGLTTDAPRVSWPETARGYPIVWITDDETRERIEAEILAQVAAKLATKRQRRTRAK